MAKLQNKLVKFLFLPAFALACLGALYSMVGDKFSRYPSKKTDTALSKRVKNNKNIKIRSVENSRSVRPRDLKSKHIGSIPQAKTQEMLSHLALKGIVNGGMETALAVIEDMNAKSQKLYRVGDVIEEGVVNRILPKSVIIRLNGRDEVLKLVRGSISEKEMISSVTLDRAELNDILRDKDRLLSQVKIRPVKSAQGTSGIQAASIEPGSLLERLGFQDGDIFQEINGAAIRSPYKLTAIYEGLKLVPFNLLPYDDLGQKIGSILPKVDSQANGVIQEVSDVYRKIESGDDIPVSFSRNGKRQDINIRIN